MRQILLKKAEYPIFDMNLCTIIHDYMVCFYNPNPADQRKYSKWPKNKDLEYQAT